MAAALISIVEASPQVDHFLVARALRETVTPEDLERAGLSGAWISTSLFRFMRELSVQRRLAYDAVHYHSTGALLVSPILRATRKPARHIFSPHAFRHLAANSAFAARTWRWVEASLMRGGMELATCGLAELDEAPPSVMRKAGLWLLPNIPAAQRSTSEPSSEHLCVVQVGRVVRQKGPERFAALAYAMPEYSWVWIGGGDPDLTDELVRAGVQVTGWIPSRDVFARMAQATVFLSTSHWEGMPVAVLDAVAMRLPVLHFELPCLVEMGMDGALDDTTAISEIRLAMTDTARRAALRRSAIPLESMHSPENLSRAASRIYRASP